MTDPDIFEWQLADVLADQRALFILWAVKTLFCTRKADFLREYQFEEQELDDLLHRLTVMGFLQEDGADLVLTEAGRLAVSRLHTAPAPSAENNLARVEADIEARFNLPKERIYVEKRLIEQLQQLGWIYPWERDPGTPYLAEEGRPTYRDVLLKERLGEAIHRINSSDGKPAPTIQQINEAIGELERISTSGAGLLEINKKCTQRLLEGTYVSGTPDYLGGRERHLLYIDSEHLGNNEFLVLNQFRVEVPGRGTFIVPDIVLFVNGIPLVVIECKSPDLTDPIEVGVAQLHRYASQEEGVPALFHFNVFLIATCFYLAKVGTLGASAEDYQPWKDSYPRKREQLVQDLAIQNLHHLSHQQLLVAGTLRKENLIDLLQNFILFRPEDGREVKLIARYQQYRAVQKAIERLQRGQRKAEGQDDQRGGIIWHTQGSGKSLTMVFLIRKMRRLPVLSAFKIVIITDRQDLQDQLAQIMQLTSEKIHVARSIPQARAMLARHSDDIIFVMIQKARADGQDDEDEDIPTLPVLDDSPDILLIVDEAHRSHTSKLHRNIMNALPNSAKIGFTGTPILMGTQKTTESIFGSFIDKYTILQAEEDGATVPILYEGYQAFGIVVREQQLDQAYDYIVKGLSPELCRQIANLYSGEGQVLEAQEFIGAKAHHMLLHYAANILPNNFKAMVVTRSREAAVRYQGALMRARQDLVDTLEHLDSSLLDLPPEQRAELPQGTQLLLQAYPQRDLLTKLESAAVISAAQGDEPAWEEWSDEYKRKEHINRFKLPLGADNHRSNTLALLCVQRMLLTGFDVPILQGLYLDQRLSGHSLLQAVARVNRTHDDKTYGLVVDYLGIARQLKEALLVYSAEEIQGALTSIQDELLKLEARHLRVKALFSEHSIDISKINLKQDVASVDACLNLLEDKRLRADFEEKWKKFTESMDAVLPRPEAMQYIHDMQVLGYIHNTLANLHPEDQISMKGTGKKVRKLIDEHIEVLGIEQTVAPISITDADFENKVDWHKSDQTKALEMEHLARYYIRQHYEEDPEYYERLSQRLEDILRRLKEQWSELVVALRPYIQDLRQGRPPDPTGLDPRTQLPFLDILAVEASRGSERYHISPRDTGTRNSTLLPEQRKDLAPLTVQLVEMMRRQVRRRDFWRGSQGRRALVADIIEFLDVNQIITPDSRQNAVADRIADLAKQLHPWLIA